MKKLFLLLLITFTFSCTLDNTETEEVINTEVLDKTVRVEVNTLQENDAVYISYYDYITDTYIFDQYFFDYDSSGNANPIVITLNDYDFRYVTGEVYRNNSIPSQLSLKVFVDDEIVVDESETGDGSAFVNIKFNYDIAKQENI